eukprot:1812161-Rhodomonas_salina.1
MTCSAISKYRSGDGQVAGLPRVDSQLSSRLLGEPGILTPGIVSRGEASPTDEALDSGLTIVGTGSSGDDALDGEALLSVSVDEGRPPWGTRREIRITAQVGMQAIERERWVEVLP